MSFEQLAKKLCRQLIQVGCASKEGLAFHARQVWVEEFAAEPSRQALARLIAATKQLLIDRVAVQQAAKDDEAKNEDHPGGRRVVRKPGGLGDEQSPSFDNVIRASEDE